MADKTSSSNKENTLQKTEIVKPNRPAHETYAYGRNYSTKHVRQKLETYTAAVKDSRLQKELLIFNDVFIHREKQIASRRPYKYHRYRQERGNTDSMWRGLRNLQLIDNELDRRRRIRIVRLGKRIYSKKSLSKTFKKTSARGRNKYKSKISQQKRYGLKRKYSHKELIEFVQHYGNFTKTEQQQKDMDDIIDQYRDTQQKKSENRGHRNNKIIQAAGSRMDGEKVTQEFEKIDKLYDTQDRNITVKKAKDYYHRNYSLSKDFKKAKTKTKIKDRDKG